MRTSVIGRVLALVVVCGVAFSCRTRARTQPASDRSGTGAAHPSSSGAARAPEVGPRAQGDVHGGSSGVWPPIGLIGRFDPPSVEAANAAGARAIRFAWSGSTIEARFKGSSISVRLGAAPKSGEVGAEKTTPYTVLVDDRPPVIVEVSSRRERYDLATGLDPAKSHRVRLVREIEALAGAHELRAVELGEGGTFLPVAPRARRIEVVGDSISCGYGVLGANARCRFSYSTERASLAYAARLGDALDADVTTVCWSGRGVVRNYDPTDKRTMPELFELAVPEPPEVEWAFASAPRPDVVVVGLGTNDYLGGKGEPLDEQKFEEGFVAFAKRIRAVYPSAFLVLMTSPMLEGSALAVSTKGTAKLDASAAATTDAKAADGGALAPGAVGDRARARLESVVRHRRAQGDENIELVVVENDAPHWGCDGHPDVAMNQRMADRIAKVISARRALGDAGARAE